MDVLAVVLLVILFFVVVSIKTSIANRIGRLEHEIMRLREQLAKSLTARSPAETPPAPGEQPKTESEKWKPAFKVYEETIKAQAPKEEPTIIKGPVIAPPRQA